MAISQGAALGIPGTEIAFTPKSSYGKHSTVLYSAVQNSKVLYSTA